MIIADSATVKLVLVLWFMLKPISLHNLFMMIFLPRSDQRVVAFTNELSNAHQTNGPR